MNDIEVYWKRRENCKQGKHKLKENNFGITWCVVCGYLFNKPAPIIKGDKNSNKLQPEDQIIWNKLISYENKK